MRHSIGKSKLLNIADCKKQPSLHKCLPRQLAGKKKKSTSKIKETRRCLPNGPFLENRRGTIISIIRFFCDYLHCIEVDRDCSIGSGRLYQKHLVCDFRNKFTLKV